MIRRLRAILTDLPSARDLSPVLVGVVSIALITVAVAFALAVGNYGLLESRYEMSGAFVDTGGLRKGADVKVAGVKVGTVTAIKPDYDLGQVIMTWKVDKGVKLGSQTRAEVALGTLLGGLYLKLSGPVAEPYIDDLPRAKRRIPLERTDIPTTVLDALGSATNVLTKLDAETVNRVLTEVAEATERNQEKYGPLLESFNRLAGAITTRGADLDELVENSQRLTTALAEKDVQLAQLIENANVIFERLANRRSEVANIFGQGSDRLRDLSNLLAGKRGQISALFSSLGVALEAADRKLPELNEGFAWSGPTFSGLAGATKVGPWINGLFEGIGPDALGLLADLYPQLGLE